MAEGIFIKVFFIVSKTPRTLRLKLLKVPVHELCGIRAATVRDDHHEEQS